MAGFDAKTPNREQVAGAGPDPALFTGHPLEMGTETVATIVAGKVAYRNPKYAWVATGGSARTGGAAFFQRTGEQAAYQRHSRHGPGG